MRGSLAQKKFENPWHRVPDFRKANYEGLKRYLEEINWRQLEREGEVRPGSLGDKEGEGRSDKVLTGGESVRSELRRHIHFSLTI